MDFRRCRGTNELVHLRRRGKGDRLFRSFDPVAGALRRIRPPAGDREPDAHRPRSPERTPAPPRKSAAQRFRSVPVRSAERRPNAARETGRRRSRRDAAARARTARDCLTGRQAFRRNSSLHPTRADAQPHARNSHRASGRRHDDAHARDERHSHWRLRTSHSAFRTVLRRRSRRRDCGTSPRPWRPADSRPSRPESFRGG